MTDLTPPVPLLLVRHATIPLSAVRTLLDEERLTVFVRDDLSIETVELAEAVAAIVVATDRDPLNALTYVVTSGASRPILVAHADKKKSLARDVLNAGALAALHLPIVPAAWREIVPLLLALEHRGRTDPHLRVLMDPLHRRVSYRDKTVMLSQREFAALYSLSEVSGRPVAHDVLARHVLGRNASANGAKQCLEVHMHNVRTKLKRLHLPGSIQTVRGFGYIILPDRQLDLVAP